MVIAADGKHSPMWNKDDVDLRLKVINNAQHIALKQYRIAGNFWGRKLSRIGEKYDFHGENIPRLLARAVLKDTTPPNFMEKTFANNHKTVKFAKVLSLESFLLYGTSVNHFKIPKFSHAKIV